VRPGHRADDSDGPHARVDAQAGVRPLRDSPELCGAEHLEGEGFYPRARVNAREQADQRDPDEEPGRHARGREVGRRNGLVVGVELEALSDRRLELGRRAEQEADGAGH
jgi:hypothetical protein